MLQLIFFFPWKNSENPRLWIVFDAVPENDITRNFIFSVSISAVLHYKIILASRTVVAFCSLECFSPTCWRNLSLSLYSFFLHFILCVIRVIPCSDLSRNEDFALYRPRRDSQTRASSSLFTLFRSFVCKSFDTYLPTWRSVSYLYSHERFPSGIRLRATSFLIRLFRLRLRPFIFTKSL